MGLWGSGLSSDFKHMPYDIPQTNVEMFNLVVDIEGGLIHVYLTKYLEFLQSCAALWHVNNCSMLLLRWFGSD